MTVHCSRSGWAAFAWIGLWVALAGSAHGLDPERRFSQYLHKSWQDPLPHTTVQDILQSADGYLWIATQEGLARFDGARFTVFTAQDTPELGNGDILALHQDPSGVLWIATRGSGVVTYIEERFDAIEGPDDGPSNVVFSMISDREGDLWIATLGGLLHLNQGSWAHYGMAEGLPHEVTRVVHEDGGGRIWVATRESGLSLLRGDRFIPWRPEGLSAADAATLDVVCLLEGRDGGLWVGTRSHGLLRAGENAVAVLATPKSLGGAAVVDLLEDDAGNLWIATYGGGLSRFDGQRVESFTTSDGLASDIVLALLQDRENSLWIGSSGGGLERLRDSVATPFTSREGLGSDYVYCVLEDRSGRLWVGTEGGGLNEIRDGAVRTWTTDDGLSSNHVTALLEDKEEALWIGTRDGGLNRMRDGHIEHFSRDDGLSSDSIFSLLEDQRGRIWVGTIRGGLTLIEAGHARPYGGDDPALTTGSIFALGLDAAGQLLVGTDGAGLKVIGPDHVRTWSTEEGLSHDTVLSLHTESDGTIWAGTYGGGLNRIRDGQVASISTSEGLWNDRVFAILEDDRGRFWLTCNQGVFVVDKQALDEYFSTQSPLMISTVFGKADGMPSAECAAGTHPSGWRAANGAMWFATDGGVARIDPAILQAAPRPPPVRIEHVVADGVTLTTTAELRLDPNIERLEVRYTALALADPEQVTFRYRLEGFDRDWIESGASRTTTFTSLPTGRRYRFVVTAANKDGVWNPDGATFSFYVAPHFYERPAFLGLVGLALLLIVRGAYGLRVRHLLRRTQALEATVAERTAEVVEEKERVEDANRELARLNQIKSEFLAIAAHDLKNPLTVIQGYANLMAANRVTDPHSVVAENRDRTRMIAASVNQMLNTIDDLLDTTAIESGKLRLETRPTDLGLVASEVVARNSVRAQLRGISLSFELDPEDLYPARVDGGRVGRVFDNLISNAIKYSQDGANVTVGLERHQSDGASMIRFRVRDHGPGLNEADQRRLFQRFERLSAKPAGGEGSTGIGLSIVKKFVTMHGGSVSVASRLGEGATFFVDLPAIGSDELEAFERGDRLSEGVES